MKRAVVLWLTVGLLPLGVPAMAAELPIEVSVGGSFPTLGSNQLLSGSELLLEYTGGTYHASLPDNGQSADIDLGSFTAYSTAKWLEVQAFVLPFTLNITFVQPAGVDGGSPQTFDATVGGVLTHFAGGLAIVFDDAGRSLTFDGSDGTGAFDFKVNNAAMAFLGAGSADMRLTADAKLSSLEQRMPEPIAYEVFGAGLACAVLLLSRRHSRLSR